MAEKVVQSGLFVHFQNSPYNFFCEKCNIFSPVRPIAFKITWVVYFYVRNITPSENNAKSKVEIFMFFTVGPSWNDKLAMEAEFSNFSISGSCQPMLFQTSSEVFVGCFSAIGGLKCAKTRGGSFFNMANFLFHQIVAPPFFATKITILAIFRDFLGRIGFSLYARDHVEQENRTGPVRANFNHVQWFYGCL